MSVINMFKSAKVKRLERMCKSLACTAGAHHQAEIRLRNELAEKITECKLLADRNLELHDEVVKLRFAKFDRDNLYEENVKLHKIISDLQERNTLFFQTNSSLNWQISEITEARDAVSAASKFLRDRCDMQDAVLKLVAVYGEKHPGCVVRIAKAVVES